MHIHVYLCVTNEYLNPSHQKNNSTSTANKPQRTRGETQHNSPKQSDFGAPPSTLDIGNKRQEQDHNCCCCYCEGKRVTLFAFHRPMEEEVQLLDVSQVSVPSRSRPFVVSGLLKLFILLFAQSSFLNKSLCLPLSNSTGYNY